MIFFTKEKMRMSFSNTYSKFFFIFLMHSLMGPTHFNISDSNLYCGWYRRSKSLNDVDYSYDVVLFLLFCIYKTQCVTLNVASFRAYKTQQKRIMMRIIILATFLAFIKYEITFFEKKPLSRKSFL